MKSLICVLEFYVNYTGVFPLKNPNSLHLNPEERFALEYT